MVRIVVRDRVQIEGLDVRSTRRIKRELRIVNPEFQRAVKHSGLEESQIRHVPKYLNLYRQENGSIYVPRGYKCPEMHGAEANDKRQYAPYEEQLPSIKVTPNTEQNRVLGIFEKEIRTKKERPFGNYMNVLEVASGKTILAAMMAAKLGQRTLVFVHTELIMLSWIADLCKMFGNDYKKEIGIIRGPKALVGPHFTIAMSQTWTRRTEHWAKWWKLFGTMIFDECHVCPSTTFRNIADRSPAAYRIGITGTPTRKDGMHRVMYRIFGTAFYNMKTRGQETDNSMPVRDVCVVKTDTELADKQVKTVMTPWGRHKLRVNASEDVDYVSVMKTVCQDKKRSMLVAKKVVQTLLADPTNSALVVSHRVDHANYLANCIGALWSGRLCVLAGFVRQADMVEAERDLRERRIRCAVATIQRIKVGASIPPFNRLFITTTIGGKEDLEQLIGRVRRKDPLKKNVMIYHFVDWRIRMCRRHYVYKALPYYRNVLKAESQKNLFISM